MPELTDRVMVIDDDDVMREVLSLLLGAEGHSVLTAESGDAALALLATLPPEERPSVLLTDLKMPGLSQSALARRLRSACPEPAVIVAMSGSEPARGEAEPFDAFLLKPFSVADLEAAVERAHGGAKLALPRSPGRRRKPDRAGVAVLDETVFAKLFAVMGTASLPQLYGMFLKDAGVRVERMRAAAAVGDQATFIREAHAIKGGCGMLGAVELQSLADRMETGGLAGSPLLDDFGSASERLRRILDERMGGFEKKHPDLQP